MSLNYRFMSLNTVALVDADDYDRLCAHKWSATISGAGKVYAHRRRKICDGGKREGLLNMHRIVMGVQDDKSVCVDHINGDTLDNRKCNLRVCSQSENMRNLKLARSMTGLRGVVKTVGGRWRVRIRINYKLIEVGTFDTARDASIAYRFASRHLHGEFGSAPGHEQHR